MSNTAEDTLDLMCDEFKRIKACCNNSEIEGLCDRAISEIQRRVPIVKELEQVKNENSLLQAKIIRLSSVNEHFNNTGAT